MAAAHGPAGRLRLLVLAVADHCDQRCAHCSIWRGAAGATSLDPEERAAVAQGAIDGGVEAVLFTGGEPLLAADLWPLAARLRAAGARTMVATNGMLLDTYARRVAAVIDEVYVSLDGASAAVHDGVRGVTAMPRLAAGMAALRAAGPAVRCVARCTLHARNLHEFPGVIDTARRLGFDAVSFLPLDAASPAFGGQPEARRRLIPSAAQVSTYERAVDALEEAGGLADGFVLESRGKLRRLARHLRASAGETALDAPDCDAPWWSAVVDADGGVRPCFFQPVVGHARDGVEHVRQSAAYRRTLATLGPDNPICARCVCPKRGFGDAVPVRTLGRRLRQWVGA